MAITRNQIAELLGACREGVPKAERDDYHAVPNASVRLSYYVRSYVLGKVVYQKRYIDGTFYDGLNFSIESVPFVSDTLTFSAPGYQTWSRSPNLRVAMTNHLAGRLAPSGLCPARATRLA